MVVHHVTDPSARIAAVFIAWVTRDAREVGCSVHRFEGLTVMRDDAVRAPIRVRSGVKRPDAERKR